MLIPKVTSPLAKAARTSEGALVALVNVGLVVGASIDPSKLPPKYAAVVAGALTGLHAINRTLLKVVAVQKGVGLASPIPLQIGSATSGTPGAFIQWSEGITGGATKLVGEVKAKVDEAEAALKEAQETDGDTALPPELAAAVPPANPAPDANPPAVPAPASVAPQPQPQPAAVAVPGAVG